MSGKQKVFDYDAPLGRAHYLDLSCQAKVFMNITKTHEQIQKNSITSERSMFEMSVMVIEAVLRHCRHS